MAARSQLFPQSEYWYEDLPVAGELFVHRDPKVAERMNTPSLDEDMGSVSEKFIEISRASSLLRGLGLLFGFFIGIPIYCFLTKLMIVTGGGNFRELPVAAFFIWFMYLFFVPAIMLLLIRTDTRIPRDIPVRFNRSTGKVYANEFKFTWNPFTKWQASIREVNWSSVKGEITKQSGYNGKAYVTRYALVLASCKPGTHEVVERIQLKGNMPTTLELYQMWRYVGLYMRDGLKGLPTGPVRDRKITFASSFFEYMPYLNPTAMGRQWWKETGWLALLLVPITLPVFWILLPAGLGHYIAMKLAPDSKWPPEIDTESRS